MKLWKRNAVVAAIVLFVCVAVYLNWSYQQESTDTGKVLGQATLVGGRASDPILAPPPSPSRNRRASPVGHLHWLLRLGPAQPAAGQGQRPDHPAGHPVQ